MNKRRGNHLCSVERSLHRWQHFNNIPTLLFKHLVLFGSAVNTYILICLSTDVFLAVTVSEALLNRLQRNADVNPRQWGYSREHLHLTCFFHNQLVFLPTFSHLKIIGMFSTRWGGTVAQWVAPLSTRLQKGSSVVIVFLPYSGFLPQSKNMQIGIRLTGESKNPFSTGQKNPLTFDFCLQSAREHLLAVYQHVTNLPISSRLGVKEV